MPDVQFFDAAWFWNFSSFAINQVSERSRDSFHFFFFLSFLLANFFVPSKGESRQNWTVFCEYLVTNISIVLIISWLQNCKLMSVWTLTWFSKVSQRYFKISYFSWKTISKLRGFVELFQIFRKYFSEWRENVKVRQNY